MLTESCKIFLLILNLHIGIFPSGRLAWLKIRICLAISWSLGPPRIIFFLIPSSEVRSSKDQCKFSHGIRLSLIDVDSSLPEEVSVSSRLVRRIFLPSFVLDSFLGNPSSFGAFVFGKRLHIALHTCSTSLAYLSSLSVLVLA